MKMIIGNFKMNLSHEEIKDYINYFKDKNYSNVFFAPSNIYLYMFQKAGLNTVSQDVSSFIEGAYTGDVAAFQLKSMCIDYAIVGHSERREYYEDSKNISSKINRLLEHDIIPILCIGESLSERENNLVQSVLSKEIDEAFSNKEEKSLKNIIIAYEPIWAIGTGIVPSNEEIKETIKFIKDYIKEKYHIDLKVLYGGSVNNHNIDTLEKISNVDGYLVGGCSIKYKDFDTLINKIKG